MTDTNLWSLLSIVASGKADITSAISKLRQVSNDDVYAACAELDLVYKRLTALEWRWMNPVEPKDKPCKT